ncbi:MAG: histidine phosphatase family protein [Anaerolineae bacterium]|nr:histidine phosphatase family protein [Anaerolineae bacterium]
MRLMIVRHGQSQANVAHLLQGQSQGTLTAIGRAQAERLSQSLSQTPFDLILSSDLARAQETARIIARATGVPLELTTALREWHVGELDGQPQAILKQVLAGASLPELDFKPAGGESLRELWQRAAAFLSQLVERYPEKTVLLCSHGDFIRMLLGHLLGQEIEEAVKRKLDNTALTILEDDGQGHWVLETVNNTDHLRREPPLG